LSKIKDYYFDELIEVDDSQADRQIELDKEFLKGNPSPTNEGIKEKEVLSWVL
jgi:hypothetical protein